MRPVVGEKIACTTDPIGSVTQEEAKQNVTLKTILIKKRRLQDRIKKDMAASGSQANY